MATPASVAFPISTEIKFISIFEIDQPTIQLEICGVAGQWNDEREFQLSACYERHDSDLVSVPELGLWLRLGAVDQ